MTREQVCLTVLAVLCALAMLGTVVAIASLRADLNLLDQQVAALPSGLSITGDDWFQGANGVDGSDMLPTTRLNAPTGRIQGITTLSNTLKISVSVRYVGLSDLLYEPPLLIGPNATYQPTLESLEQARFDFLNLMTRGGATTALAFRPVPPQDERLTLVFNPSHPVADPVAPRWEMGIRGVGSGY